ncbi:MAG: xanthine dehydrogenase molybdopterin binding subunit [Cyanobacteria bacterium]|nr:xanthine dehydrogenase molybdopterin binding subunit [Cyanobacteriota bacterium]
MTERLHGTSIVGKNIPHDSSWGHVSGESLYIDDLPRSKYELYVDFVGSPIAHGILKAIQSNEALAIPGVVAIFTAQDLDGHNLFGPIIQDEVLLVPLGSPCEFIGQPIVVIAADTQKALEAAKKTIRFDIQPLPPVFTISEAKANNQVLGIPRTFRLGNLEEGWSEATHFLEGVFINGGQEHFYLESQAALVIPGEDKTLTVHSSTQSPTEVQHVVAELLGLQMNQVVCITKRMGGAFGGKETQATHFAAMAALVAHKTRRPARIALSKDDDMKYTGKRHPFETHYKVGFTPNGQITGLDIHFYSNGGALADLSTSIMGRAMSHAENAYYIPHIEIHGTVCKTNLPPNTAFRGFGGPQGIANMENIIEEIAQFLKIDAFEIRTRNLYGTDTRNITPYHQVFQHNKIPLMMDQLANSSDYQARLQAIQEFNNTSPTHLKGISLIPLKFGLSFNTKFLNQANALVNIYLDGTVQVSTGATEMGQGVNTKIKQLVAEVFQISPDWVLVMATSTEKNNNTSPTAASSGSDLNGSAAVDACEKIKARLTQFAADYFADATLGMIPSPGHIQFGPNKISDRRQPHRSLTFPELVQKAHKERVSLGERGFYITQGLDFNWDTGKGNPFLYFTTGCGVSEVLIDRFTGEMSVSRVDLLMDIGRSINPGIDRGQITGAFIQGMGWVTNEELKYSPDGALLSYSPTTYKIPNIQDTPPVFQVDWIDNPDNVMNIRGSKGIGEPPLMLAISVWTAAKHALSFLCKPGQRSTLSIPATSEAILLQIEALQQGS